MTFHSLELSSFSLWQKNVHILACERGENRLYHRICIVRSQNLISRLYAFDKDHCILYSIKRLAAPFCGHSLVYLFKLHELHSILTIVVSESVQNILFSKVRFYIFGQKELFA